MGIEKQSSGRFNGVCDGCDKTLELNAYGCNIAQYKLRLHGWKRYDHSSTHRHYLWHCTTCAAKELDL